MLGGNFLSELEADIPAHNIPDLLQGGTFDSSASFKFDISAANSPFAELKKEGCFLFLLFILFYSCINKLFYLNK
jgi:hypothetical protein